MATLSVSSGLSGTNGYLRVAETPGTQRVTWTGDGETGGVQTIGTGSHEALSIGSDFGTAGWTFFQNIDATNFVEVGRDQGGTFVPFIKLLKGEHCTVPLSSKTLYAKADTGSVKLRYRLLER